MAVNIVVTCNEMMKPLKVMRPSVALHASVDVSGSGGEDIADE